MTTARINPGFYFLIKDLIGKKLYLEHFVLISTHLSTLVNNISEEMSKKIRYICK